MLKDRIKKIAYRVPAHLRERQINDSPERLSHVRDALERFYFTGWRAKDIVSSSTYARDLNDHVIERMRNDRMRVIPWLDAMRSLNGAKILEIGCGTGASTVALSEQGATVTGVDIEEESIAVAKARCEVYGIKADFNIGNAVDVLASIEPGKFSMIIFFACLEHMTHEERLTSIRNAWIALPPQGHLAVVDTPNRLWHFDGHTSLLPFFHWLPDNLAFEYARFSKREVFNSMYTDKTTQMTHFLRRGRGISFHEFDIAIGRHKATSCIADHHRMASALRATRTDRQHVKVLRTAGVDPAWCQESLDLALIKD